MHGLAALFAIWEVHFFWRPSMLLFEITFDSFYAAMFALQKVIYYYRPVLLLLNVTNHIFRCLNLFCHINQCFPNFLPCIPFFNNNYFSWRSPLNVFVRIQTKNNYLCKSTIIIPNTTFYVVLVYKLVMKWISR